MIGNLNMFNYSVQLYIVSFYYGKCKLIIINNNYYDIA